MSSPSSISSTSPPVKHQIQLPHVIIPSDQLFPSSPSQYNHNNNPSLPTSAATPSPLSSSSSSSFPAFQLVTEYLDEQWHTLKLDQLSCSDEEDKEENNNNNNNTQTQLTNNTKLQQNENDSNNHNNSSSLASLAASWALESIESEKQLREAIRDADAADWQRDRAISDAKAAKKALETTATAAATARSDVLALQECIATLTAAHQVDAQINEVLVKDQAEEICQLRDALNKLSFQQHSSNKRCIQTFDDDINNSISSDQQDTFSSSDDGAEYESVESVLPVIEAEILAAKHSKRKNIDTTKLNKSKKDESQRITTTTTRKKKEKDKQNKSNTIKQISSDSHRKLLAASYKSIRSKTSKKMIDALRREKQNLLNTYERRHSMTVESVVRRSSSRLILGRDSPVTTQSPNTANTAVSEKPVSESSISQPEEMV